MMKSYASSRAPSSRPSSSSPLCSRLFSISTRRSDPRKRGIASPTYKHWETILVNISLNRHNILCHTVCLLPVENVLNLYGVLVLLYWYQAWGLKNNIFLISDSDVSRASTWRKISEVTGRLVFSLLDSRISKHRDISRGHSRISPSPRIKIKYWDLLCWKQQSNSPRGPDITLKNKDGHQINSNILFFLQILWNEV